MKSDDIEKQDKSQENNQDSHQDSTDGNDQNPSVTADDNQTEIVDDSEKKQTHDTRSDADDGLADKRVNDEPAASDVDADAAPSVDDTAMTSEPEVKKKPKSIAALLWLFVVSLCVASLSCSAWLYLQWQKNQDVSQETLGELRQSVDSVVEQVFDAQQGHDAYKQQSSQKIASLQQKLTLAEQRILAQNKRLIAMSTTSREDWLLAEAEYLLKLANQRVLIEKNAKSAAALLKEADAILRDLGEPDLYPLREAIQRDLVALKLVEKIDVDGMYLQLSALAEQAEAISILPESYTSEASLVYADNSTNNSADNNVDSDANNDMDSTAHDNGVVADLTSAKQTVTKSFSNFFSSFKKYFRIIDQTEKPEALLPPDSTAYLQLNLRLQLERAQLALLREQKDIYTNSLSQAERWVKRYFPSSASSTAFRKELQTLREKNIVRTLPDISNSLEMLKAYIAVIHELDGAVSKTIQNDAAKKQAVKKSQQAVTTKATEKERDSAK